jgi:putative oxidoreductase
VQRLFTTFANGWPGFGIFLQRLATGVVLVFHGLVVFNQPAAAELYIPQVAGAVLGLLVMLGLWTPLAGAMVVVTEVWIVLAGEGNSLSLILAVLGGTLAMIGPGAWSIDARLFGRKQITK